MRRYRISCTYRDRKFGPGTGQVIEVKASSPAVAIMRAAKIFWNRIGDRKQMADARSSMRLEIVSVAAMAKETSAPALRTITLDKASGSV